MIPAHNPSCDDSGPISQFDITARSLDDRFPLLQDLIAISHDDDTVTLSVRICKGTSDRLTVDVYLRAHNTEAHDTLSYCQKRITAVAERHGAAVKPV